MREIYRQIDGQMGRKIDRQIDRYRQKEGWIQFREDLKKNNQGLTTPYIQIYRVSHNPCQNKFYEDQAKDTRHSVLAISLFNDAIFYCMAGVHNFRFIDVYG